MQNGSEVPEPVVEVAGPNGVTRTPPVSELRTLHQIVLQVSASLGLYGCGVLLLGSTIHTSPSVCFGRF